jgi:hypothetical protein
MPLDQQSWQLSSLDDARAPSSQGWLRPAAVRIEGEELVFEWPDPVMRRLRLYHVIPLQVVGESVVPNEPGFVVGTWNDIRWIRGEVMRNAVLDSGWETRPGPEMLFAFARLSEAGVDRIRRFATRFGPLDESAIGTIDLPSWGGPPDLANTQTRDDVVFPRNLLVERQRLDLWISVSAAYRRLLNAVAAGSSEGGTIRHAGVREAACFEVNRLLSDSGVRPLLTFVLEQPIVEFAADGLSGGLAIELLAAIGRRGLRLCEGCGGDVGPRGRKYCGDCRERGVPGARRQDRFRARSRGGADGQES